MKNYKNYLIALLTGLLVLTLTTQPSIGAGNSSKLIEYDRCLSYVANKFSTDNFYQTLKFCKEYK